MRSGLANHPAVVAGIVTEEAAFCGLSQADVVALAQHAPDTELLVRLRSDRADGRVLVRPLDLVELARDHCTAAWLAIAHRWTFGDIRDVTLILED